MANYIAWYGKKRQLLAERERRFSALLKSGSDASKLAKSAAGIRAAQIQALKSKRAELKPAERSAIAMKNLDREIEFWHGLSDLEVIEGYRNGNLSGHRATAVRRATK